MGKYIVEISENALREIQFHKKAGNKSTISKLRKILIELEEHPFLGAGNPELLKHDLTGYWARRINKKDRLIYQVKEEIVTVLIISAKGHYRDK